MVAEIPKTVKVFCYYIETDKEEKDKIKTHLGKRYVTWWDLEFEPGDVRETRLNDYLNHADIILFLSSADLLRQDNYQHIIPRALRRHQEGTATVIPVILRPHNWESEPFARLQPLPEDGVAITGRERERLDEVFMRVGAGIRRVVDKKLRNLYVVEAKKYVENGEDKKSLLAYEKAIAVSQSDDSVFPLYRAKAEIMVHLGNFVGALEAYEQAVRNPVLDIAAYKGKADVLTQLGKYQSALEMYEQALTEEKSDIFLSMGKANVLQLLGNYQGAFETYKQTLSLHEDNPQLHAKMGELLTKMKNYRGALNAYSRSIELDPYDPQFYIGKGNILLGLRRYQEALDIYEEALNLDPENVKAWRNKANVLRRLERDDDALLAYDKAIDLDPENALLFKDKGDTFSKQGRYHEALSLYKDATNIDGHFVAAYQRMSEVYEKIAKQDFDYYQKLALERQSYYLKLAEEAYNQARSLESKEKDR